MVGSDHLIHSPSDATQPYITTRDYVSPKSEGRRPPEHPAEFYVITDITGLTLVTRGGSGIGKVCAKTFAQGAAVLDLNDQALQAVQIEIDNDHVKTGDRSSTVDLYPADVNDEAAVETVVEKGCRQIRQAGLCCQRSRDRFHT